MPFTFKNANSKRGLKFRFLTGDVNWKDYGGSFISKKLNNGEFDYWLVMAVDNLWDSISEEKGPQYMVSLSVVAPSQVGDEEMKRAYESAGLDENGTNHHSNLGLSDLGLVEMLHSYGTSATLWQKTGNNLGSLLKEARAQANGSQMMFGFMMDEAQNKLGATGWDRIKGNYWPTPE